MEDRQRLRREGKLNKRVGVPNGAARWIAQTSGLRVSLGHKWECECDICRPWLWSSEKKIGTDRTARVKVLDAQVDDHAGQRELPVIVIPITPQPKQHRKAWSNRGKSSN